MNISKGEKKVRLDKVKEFYLKGTPTKDIAIKVGATIETVEKDIKFIQSYYSKLAINNPHLVKLQFGKIQKLTDEIELVKTEFWKMYSDIVKEEETSKTLYEETKKKREEEISAGVDHKLLTKIKYPISRFGDKLDTMKAILIRIEQEAKLLNLFNPNQQSGGITLEEFKLVMDTMRTIIIELIPEEKRGCAIQKLKALPINIEDAEIIEDK